MKYKTFKQLKGKAKQNAIDLYNCWVERKAPINEIEEYFNMADGTGGKVYFDLKGNPVNMDD